MNPGTRLLNVIAGLSVLAWSLPAAVIAQGAYSQPTQSQHVPEGGKSTANDENKAKEIVDKLYGAAKADLAGHHYAEAVKAYEEALRVLEQLYGTRDPRLVEALNGIVQTRMAWDNYIAITGASGNPGLSAAVKAQERIVKIYEQEGTDPKARIAATIDLGDVLHVHQ